MIVSSLFIRQQSILLAHAQLVPSWKVKQAIHPLDKSRVGVGLRSNLQTTDGENCQKQDEHVQHGQ